MGTNDSPVSASCPNTAALSHHQIYAQLQGARPETGREVLDQMVRTIHGVEDGLAALTASLGELKNIWHAPSTERGADAVRTVQQYVEEAHQHAGTLGRGFGGYLDQLDTTRARMPEPVDPLEDAWVPIAGPTEVLAREIEHHQRTREARQLYAELYYAAVDAEAATPPFDAPAPVTVNQTGAATDPPTGTGTSTSWPGDPSNPSTPGTPTTPGAPSSPTPPAANPPAPGPGTPLPVSPAPAPPAGTGGGGLSPSAPLPVGPPGSPGGGDRGAGHGPPGPTPGPGRTPGSDRGAGSTGREHAPGAGGRGSVAGPDQSGGRAGQPRYPLIATSRDTVLPASTGPTGAGGRGAGGGFAPLGAGAGRREEDREHRRPSYLVADDANDLVGPLRKVAPPVIGARDEEGSR